MAIPNWFVNGARQLNPAGGALLCELNPPFTQHATIEILVHVPVTGIELRHYRADGSISEMLMCVNNDTVYVTVEPGDRLVAHYYASVQTDVVQCSLYAWR